MDAENITAVISAADKAFSQVRAHHAFVCDYALVASIY